MMPSMDENVTISVSQSGVFTSGLHVTIIRRCRQIKLSEQLLAKESATFASNEALAKKPLPTSAV